MPSTWGEHAVSYNVYGRGEKVVKPVHIRDINDTLFLNKLQTCELPTISGSINDITNNVTDVLYQCAKESRCEPPVNMSSNHLGR